MRLKRKAWIFLIVGFLISLLAVVFLRQKLSQGLVDKFKAQTKLSPPILKKASLSFSSPLSLETIFALDHTWTATLSAEKKITIMATGDVIPARSVNFMATKYQDFKWPFLKTAEVLRNADLTLVNLESPLIENCPLTNEGMVFCGDSRHIEGLEFSGVDVVNLANNHIENHGPEGVISTLNFLGETEVLACGGKILNSVHKNVKGLRLAFLGFNEVNINQLVASAEPQEVKDQVKRAKRENDLVIVSFHWGVEYTSQPTERQKFLAHLAIDSGADLVIGNHPHWIQPVEIYEAPRPTSCDAVSSPPLAELKSAEAENSIHLRPKNVPCSSAKEGKGKLIMYAHGNFIFDQMWSEETKLGVVGKYTFYDKKLIDAEFLPIKILNYGQPYFLEGIEKDAVIKNLRENSFNLY